MPGSYEVQILPAARREVLALPAGVRARVALAIAGLADDPRPRGCGKLVGAVSDYRIRVGDYRVLYEVNDTGRIVQVYRVRHRSRAYR